MYKKLRLLVGFDFIIDLSVLSKFQIESNTKVVFATGLSAKDETSETTVQILYRHFYTINLLIMGMGGSNCCNAPHSPLHPTPLVQRRI